MIDYKQLLQSVHIHEQTLSFDFADRKSLTAFETIEIFNYALLATNYAAITVTVPGEIQWDNTIGSLVTGLIQHDAAKREFTVAISDFGIGFLQTLRHNYPDLTTEAEAIELALKANITGRPNHRGGNGLLFLQKNIFNGFRRTLYIRSTNTLVQVKNFTKHEILTETLPFSRGATIYFNVYY